MPELVELRPELERANVRLVAVSIDLAVPQKVESVEALRAFAEERDIALPLLALSGDFDALAEARDWPLSVPFTVLIGPAGELGRIDGPADAAAIHDLIARARPR
jgi:hypothetical protein